MSRIVADGTLELQDPDNGFDFEIPVGGLDGLIIPRGTNVTLPKKTGQTWMPKRGDHYPLVLRGTVNGEPGLTARESYLTRMTTLLTIFSTLAAPFPIVVHPDAEGVGGRIAAGQIATITVEFLRLTGLPAFADRYRDFDLECRCITDPLGWVIA